jgi:Arc/MetJ-type ribon-helix-helix transcriptional regulator
MSIEKAQRRRPTSIWLTDEEDRILLELATELGMSRSAVIREALRRMRADTDMAEVRRLVAELTKAVSGK